MMRRALAPPFWKNLTIRYLLISVANIAPERYRRKGLFDLFSMRDQVE
jgi:hypothetical protein